MPNPLGLPTGSVRALVALTVVAVFLMQTLRGQSAGLLLSEAVLIVLAHYFASRRVISVPRELRQDLEVRGLLQREANPLWLPRNSVRLLILGAFTVTVVVLWRRGELLRPEVFDSLFLVLAYLTGTVFQHLRARRGAREPGRWGRAWIHLKALVVLIACLLVALLTWAEAIGGTPGWVEQALLGWILFYFGSR
jgi:hypothetical protein